MSDMYYKGYTDASFGKDTSEEILDKEDKRQYIEGMGQFWFDFNLDEYSAEDDLYD